MTVSNVWIIIGEYSIVYSLCVYSSNFRLEGSSENGIYFRNSHNFNKEEEAEKRVNCKVEGDILCSISVPLEYGFNAQKTHQLSHTVLYFPSV